MSKWVREGEVTCSRSRGRVIRLRETESPGVSATECLLLRWSQPPGNFRISEAFWAHHSVPDYWMKGTSSNSIQRILELRMDSKISCSFLYRLDTESQRAVNSCSKSPGHSAAQSELEPRSQAQDCLCFLSTSPLIYVKPMSSYQQRELHSPLSTWPNALLWFLCGI